MTVIQINKLLIKTKIIFFLYLVIYLLVNLNFRTETLNSLPGINLILDIFFIMAGFCIKLYQIKYKSLNLFIYKIFLNIIIPFLFIILLILIFGLIFIKSDDLIEISKSIIASLYFFSNVYYVFKGWSAGLDFNQSPLASTWVVSILIQYLIIIIFLNYFIEKGFAKINLIIAIIIAFLSLIAWKKGYILNSFLSHFRFFELWFGSLAASYLHLMERKKYKNILFFLGNLIILICIFSNTEIYKFNFYNLLILFGTLIFLLNLQGLKNLKVFDNLKEVTKLNFILAVFLLYLPVLFFFKYIEPDIDNFYKLLIFFLTFAIPYFLKKFGEIKNFIKSKNLLFSGCVIYLILVFSSVAIIKFDGLSWRMPEIFNNQNNNIKTNINLLNEKKRVDIFLVGDSHMNRMVSVIEKSIKNTQYNLTHLTKGGCYFMLNFYLKNEINNQKQEFCDEKFQSNRLSKILESEKPIVIIGGRLPLILTGNFFDNKEGGIETSDFHTQINHNGRWYRPHSLNNESYKEGIINSIEVLLNKNIPVILVYPVPPVGWHVPNEIYKRWIKTFNKTNFELSLSDKPISTSFQIYKEHTKESFKILDEIKNKNLFRIFPHKIFCDTKISSRCFTHDQKKIYYIDESHLSDNGVKLIWKEIYNVIKKYID